MFIYYYLFNWIKYELFRLHNLEKSSCFIGFEHGSLRGILNVIRVIKIKYYTDKVKYNSL